MTPHSGIRIDSIPADGVGGLIFALGMAAIVWIAVPALQPVMIGCLIGGLLFAPIFHALGH
jgi:hypothetical protein